MKKHAGWITLGALLAVATRCGSSGSPQGPSNEPPTDPGPLLDFSAVAGTWSGWDVTNDLWIRFTLEPSARRDEVVGTQVVGGVDRIADELFEECTQDVIAKSV